MLDRGPPQPSPTAEADGSEAADVPFGALQQCVALRDWLLSEGARMPKAEDLLSGLAERLIALDVPVDRATTAIDALHSEYSGVGRFWTRETGSTVRLFPHGEASDRAYRASPFFRVHETGEWLILDLAETPDDAFAVIPDLKAEGYRHYIVAPLFFTNGTRNGISFATRSETGFRDEDVAILRFVMPTLAAVMEMRSVNKQLDHVLRIYVGDEPHKAILGGSIRRGHVQRIRSAILFADMRDYTRISADMTPEEAVDLLNIFFDCLVPAIEREGGEVLNDLLRQGGYRPESVTVTVAPNAADSRGASGNPGSQQGQGAQGFPGQGESGANQGRPTPDQAGRRSSPGGDPAASDLNERKHESVSSSPDRSGVYL